MKRFFKIYILASGRNSPDSSFWYLGYFRIKWGIESARNMKLAGEPAPTLEINGHSFRDLNKNGKLDVYEDIRAPQADRVEDLIQQMNVEGKSRDAICEFFGNEARWIVVGISNGFRTPFLYFPRILLLPF